MQSKSDQSTEQATGKNLLKHNTSIAKPYRAFEDMKPHVQPWSNRCAKRAQDQSSKCIVDCAVLPVLSEMSIASCSRSSILGPNHQDCKAAI